MAIKVQIEMATLESLQRKAELLDGALAWICDHTAGATEYAQVCSIIGMNASELDNEMAECGLSKEETKVILDWINSPTDITGWI